MRLVELFQLDELTPTPDEVRQFSKSNAAHTTAEIHKTMHWKDPVTAFATKYGFKPLGSGQFATVYGSPNYPFVIKLFASGDKAYFEWLKFCRTHQNNRFIPKLRGGFIKISDHILAIRMEPLTKITFGLNYSKYEGLETILTKWDKLNTDQGEIEFKTYYEREYQRVVDHYPDFKDDRDIIEICEFLSEYQNHEINLDLHDENLMMRGNQVVITDPLYMVKWISLSEPK